MRNKLIEAKEQKAGVLLISEDLDEIFAVSDWVAPIYEGKFMDIIPVEKAKRESIGAMMAGITLEEVAGMRIGSHELKPIKGLALAAERQLSFPFWQFLSPWHSSALFSSWPINPLAAYQEIFSYAFANPFGLPLTINRFIFPAALYLCIHNPLSSRALEYRDDRTVVCRGLGRLCGVFAFGE